MYDKNIKMEIAKQIGEPISPVLPVPVELSEIANIETVGVGEKVYRFTAVDDTADIIYKIAADGSLTEIKREPVADTEVSFTGLNSNMEYVLVDDILSASDNVSVLGRRKASITRGMDKKEVYTVLQGVMGEDTDVVDAADTIPGVGVQEATASSGDDLWDLIMAMKHKVEDDGDDYVLLCGSTVKEKIDTYSKDKAATHNYNVGLKQMLADVGIKVMKVYGSFDADNASDTKQILGSNKMILVARNSRIAQGKPITFVRRRISPELAKLMGADVDSAQRVILSGDSPIIVGGANTFGYSVWGYESVVFLITNPYAIVKADATSVI